MAMILREIGGGDGRGWNSALEAKWGKRTKSKKELVKSRTCTAQTQVCKNAAVGRVARTPRPRPLKAQMLPWGSGRRPAQKFTTKSCSG
jgi:hypothetical protein